MRIKCFRVQGVRPTWSTAYVTGAVEADASPERLDTLRTSVRDRFQEDYPDATNVREHEWTEEKTDE